MWHYEYTIDRMLFRFPADTFEDCLTALLVARGSSPLMTDPRIFHGGSRAIGSGSKVFDQHEKVGYARSGSGSVVVEQGSVTV